MYPFSERLTKTSRHSSLFAPALSGEAARLRAATLPLIDVLNYASGKAAAAALLVWRLWCSGWRREVGRLHRTPSHNRRAGRGSLLWAPTKRGREHRHKLRTIGE